MGGHVILAPPPDVAPRGDRTSPVLVLVAIISGLLALAVAGYAVLAPDVGLLAGLSPKPTPTAVPTPAKTIRPATPAPFLGTGPMTFGVDYDPDSFLIEKPATRFRIGVKEIAWNATLMQPASATSLTFRIARVSKGGAEEVLHRESLLLFDPAVTTVAATFDLTAAAGPNAGTYVVRLLRGGVDVLAEGTLTLVK